MINARLFLDALVAVTALTTSLLIPTPSPQLLSLSGFIHPAKATRRPAKSTAVKSYSISHKRPLVIGRIFTVTATTYQAVPGQTDAEPFVTADNSRIKPHYGSKKRWLALSNDLLKRWGGHFDYGDQVRVRGISPELDGIYTVHDTMNRRHRRCLDVLTHPSEKINILTKGVTIQRVSL